MLSKNPDEHIYLSSLPSSQYPLQINLEFTNHCNLQCSFCINKEPFFRKKGLMEEKLIDILIKQLPKETIIVICGIGEPMLHPKFTTFINKLSQHFTQLYLITNGQLLTEKSIDSILHSHISKLTVSLDYFSPTQYKREKHGNIHQVIKNIQTLLNMRKKTKNSVLKTIQINMLAQRGNEQDIIDAIKFFSPLLESNDYIYSRNIKTLGGLVQVHKKKNSYIWTTLDEFKNQISQTVDVSHYRTENWIKYLGLTQPLSKRLICRHPFIYCMVLFDGRVTACCIDFNGSLILGNIKQQNIKDIWNGAKYQLFRKKMKDLNFKQYPICARCEEYYKYK